MGGGIYVALSGAIAQTELLDSTATNLANASTVGYQRVRPVFREALAESEGSVASTSVTVSGTPLDTSRGALRQTGRSLDVTLPEKSYLSVSTPQGERFTRAGSLETALDGTLVAGRSGPAVMGEDGKPIRTKPAASEVKVTPTGEVWQGDARLGRLRVVSFSNPERLSPEGGTLLNATAAAGAAAPSSGQLAVGCLEESNSSVVGAMTDLVTASRAFDAFQRALDVFHTADQEAVTSVAKYE